jgi:hypothetical protein
LIRFKFFDSKSTGTTPTRTIILPAPLNLSNNYNVAFDDLEAGLLERAIVDGGEAIAGVVDAIGNPNSDALDISAAVAGGFADVLTNTTGNILGGLGSVRRILGSNVNKKNELVINKPQIRSFNFRFQLVPTNSEETETIQEIIKVFKIAMHPPTNESGGGDNGQSGKSAGGIFFMNPARVKIDFLFQDIQNTTGNYTTENVNRKIFTTSFCFIRNLDVNYHNAGAPSYFGDGQPGNMAFSVQLDEAKPNSREMISKLEYGPNSIDNNGQVAGFETNRSISDEATDRVADTLNELGVFNGE